jgi:hypothetical protein
MATITAGSTLAVAAPFNSNPAYSGTFIPTLWSSKLNAKFYAATVFGDIANTNWEGEISGVGDKVVINNIPDIAISTYTPGAGLTYQVPTPSTVELQIDKGKYFAFQVNDLLKMQSQPKLLDVFSGDAAMQMKIQIDSNVMYRSLLDTSYSAGGAFVATNRGATAGAKSGAYNLGTEASPIQFNATSTSAVDIITRLSAVLDEQNIPETDRFLVIGPNDRQVLMNSNLAQAYLTGDSQSIVRNGKIGQIDRFTVYVSNQLPWLAASGTSWNPGAGAATEPSLISATTNANKRRLIFAGHKSALTFASQMTKMETVRNPNDFGDFVRGVNVYGFKVVKGEALAAAIVY